ncbi:MAG: hypothetical protein ROW48_18035 [Bellilinea sp.]
MRGTIERENVPIGVLNRLGNATRAISPTASAETPAAAPPVRCRLPDAWHSPRTRRGKV